MTILDSNVWIAYLNQDDSLHQKAKKIFEKINKQSEKIVIPEYIILEVSSVLLMKTSKKTADMFIEFALDNQDIKILHSNISFFTKLTNFFLKYSKKQLSFVDISLLYLSQEYQIITFDKKLEKAILKI